MAAVALAPAACGDASSPALTATEPTSPSTTTGTTAPITTPETTTPAPTTTLSDTTASTLPVLPAVAPVGTTLERSVRTADGRNRTYRLYVPSNLSTDRAVPLLVALHGGVGSGRQFQRTSGFDGLAEANGFLVAFPDGIGAGPTETDLRTWNAGSCCGQASEKQVDDVAFIDRLLDDVAAIHPVDPERIYVAGHSNGAMMAYRLACELSDRIVAIGVQAGSVMVDACTPTQPISVFHLHGDADDRLPIEGGIGSELLDGAVIRSATDSIGMFVAATRCDPTPTASTDPTNPDVTTSAWSGCDGGVEVVLTKVDGAGHPWMGHPSPRGDAVAPSYPNLDASLAVWSFLARQVRLTDGS